MIITLLPKPWLLRVLTIALLLSCAVAISATQRNIVILGDSISAAYGMARQDGWVALLRERIAKSHPRYEVINASISGETTGGGLTRLPQLLEKHRPEVIVLELGGNDGLRGHPLGRIHDNLQAMIDMARKQGARVVLLPMEIPPNYGPRYTQGFRDIFSELGAQTHVIKAPFILRDIATEPRLMQDDGIHPTAQAQPIILETVMPALQEALAP